MPAKITLSDTNNLKGDISISDVHKTINDYVTKVNLACADPTRNPVLKHFNFSIELARIHSMIESTTGSSDKTFRIYFTLNLPNQLDCDNSVSLENYLSILVCCVDKDGVTSRLKVGDFILAEGFADHVEGGAMKLAASPQCCVQGDPPNN